MPDAVDPQNARPIRAETRATLVATIARGRRCLKDIVDELSITAEPSLSARSAASAGST